MCEKNAFEIKNIGFWTMLFLFCFYAYKIDKGNSDKMDIITKNLGSTSFQPCMTCIGNIDQMLVKMATESKKTPNLSRNFEKKSLFRLLLLANTFYDCLFKTCNQIQNGTIDFLFKMHLVWSLEVPKNQKCLEKVTQFSENFVF